MRERKRVGEPLELGVLARVCGGFDAGGEGKQPSPQKDPIREVLDRLRQPDGSFKLIGAPRPARS